MYLSPSVDSWDKNEFVTDHKGAQYVLNISSNCIIFIVPRVLLQIFQVHFPLSVVLPWQFFLSSSVPRHKLFKATSCCQICSPSLDSWAKPICHWPRGRPVCVEHSQQLYSLLSFSMFYHRLFKATFHCQLCSHDTSHLTSVTVSSQLFKATSCCRICFPSLDSCDKNQFVTDHECPSTRWTFPAIALSFIVPRVLSQIVQGYFPLSVVLPWLLFLSSSASHHKLLKGTSRCQICFSSPDSCDKNQFVTDH